MSIRLQLPKVTDLKPRITVMGVGGAGGNAVNNMIAAGLQGVDFVVANTDAQALAASSAEHRIQLGTNLTEGLGAGSKPEIGEAAAEEAIDDIRAQIAGSHMLFVAAGMGGGTGTGAASVIARTARELGILTVAVVTKPFQFEGARRLRIAEAGIIDLKDAVDTLIVIPNQNLFRISTERTTFAEAFVLADQVLYSGIACIVDLIVKEGLINLDLADVKTVLAGMGTAMMGTGEAAGEERARLAAEEAIQNPLLDDISLKGARGLLVSIIGGHDLTLYEVDAAASRVRQEVDPDANIIVGATFDETLGDRVRVSIVASGMMRGAAEHAARKAATKQPPPLPGAAPASAMVAAMPPQPQTPPLGSGQPQMRSQSEFERRLADALEPGHGYATKFDGQLGQPMPPRPAASANGFNDRSDVTVEVSEPQYLDHLTETRSPMSDDRGLDLHGVRQETVETLTTPARGRPRPAELQDFPHHAQQAYRARVDGHMPPHQAVPAGAATSGVAAKKPSIFQRITGAGRVRKANAADPAEAPPQSELPGFLARGKR